jgi:hypothetical protein
MFISQKKIHEYQEFGFDMFISLTYILLFLYFSGISNEAKIRLETIDKYIKIYICLFLIYRFNPFRGKSQFTSLDRKIAFSAGLFIFTTSFLGFEVL